MAASHHGDDSVQERLTVVHRVSYIPWGSVPWKSMMYRERRAMGRSADRSAAVMDLWTLHHQ